MGIVMDMKEARLQQCPAGSQDQEGSREAKEKRFHGLAYSMLSDLIVVATLRTIAVMHLEPQPLSSKLLFRIMLVLIIFFSIMAGYYRDRFEVWRTNNALILEKFDVQSTQELLKKEVEVQ